MKILFLTLLNITNLNEHGIYHDLLREFYNHGHQITVVSPIERRENDKTHLISNEQGTFLKVKTGNLQKSSIIEKGIATILLERQFITAIKKYLGNITFDLILYSTPPITFAKVVEYLKSKQNAKTYLLLKDIFPQNAVDMGMLSKRGIKGLLYRYFRSKEKRLYAISDSIGCMSPANVKYILEHNPEISQDKVEVCPNCIEPQDLRLTDNECKEMRNKYGIPLDKKVFVYGGNLGKPQGIPFFIECLKTQLENTDTFFLIVGDGTEYSKLESFFNDIKPLNMKLMKRLPKEDYDRMIAACDVGLIFLDHRFTIPNFPSRLLSYMQAGLPVLACTDPNMDIGKMIVSGGFGWWCESDDTKSFNAIMTYQNDNNITTMSQNSYKYLCENCMSINSYKIIYGFLKEMN